VLGRRASDELATDQRGEPVAQLMVVAQLGKLAWSVFIDEE